MDAAHRWSADRVPVMPLSQSTDVTYEFLKLTCKQGKMPTVKLSQPAPIFSGSAGGPSLATIYFAHYRRLVSVLDAARTGNLDLVKIAVAHQDKFGCQDEPQPTTFTRVAPADGGGHEASVEKA